MTYPNITTIDVEAKVREIAAADPDHVYQSSPGGKCTNIPYHGSEACLIGRALVDLGVSEDLIIEKELIDICASLTLENLDIKGEAEWLDDVQNAQDLGHAWGIAIERADES